MSKHRLAVLWLWIIPLWLLVTAGISACDVRIQAFAEKAQTQTSAAETQSKGNDSERHEEGTKTSNTTQIAIKTEPLPQVEDGTPISSPTSAPTGPMVQVSANTNCRTGPGLIYDTIGVLERDELAEVVGKSADRQYWVIKNPDGSGECWLWSYYAIVTGSTAGIVILTPPPTPSPTPTPTITPTGTPVPTSTPVFTWVGIWSIATGPIDGDPDKEFVMNIKVAGQTLTGSVDIMGNFITYTGTISDNMLVVSGTWSDQARGGLFKFIALGTDQFQGYSAYGLDRSSLCGARGGAGLPSPCYGE